MEGGLTGHTGCQDTQATGIQRLPGGRDCRDTETPGRTEARLLREDGLDTQAARIHRLPGHRGPKEDRGEKVKEEELQASLLREGGTMRELFKILLV